MASKMALLKLKVVLLQKRAGERKPQEESP
jgi:hypothetical protein